LRQHQATMDEQLALVQWINTGLTTVMDQSKFSELTPFDARQNIAGP
jgi:hypothetical protein